MNSWIARFGLLIIPIVFGVVHAQDNNAASGNDPFELMLNQAREEQRQKILQDFSQNQKENEAQNSSIANKAASANQQGTADQANTNPSSDKNVASGSSPAAPGLPPSNVPLPNANPTNTNPLPNNPPANIYVPPPPPAGVGPPSGGESRPALPPQTPQAPANLYR